MKLTELIGRLTEIEEVYGGDENVTIAGDEGDSFIVKHVSRERDDYSTIKDGKIVHHERYMVLIQ